MTELELQQIEARLSAASPGPWAFNSYSAVCAVPLFGADKPILEAWEAEGDPCDELGNAVEPFRSQLYEAEAAVCFVPPHHGDTAMGRHYADAVFIEHARQDIPALIAEIRRLQVEAARAEEKGAFNQRRKMVDELAQSAERARLEECGVHWGIIDPVEFPVLNK